MLDHVSFYKTRHSSRRDYNIGTLESFSEIIPLLKHSRLYAFELEVFFDNAGGQLKKPMGMCFGPDGTLYVASQGDNAVHQLEIDQNQKAVYKKIFLTTPDHPLEFIHWV